MKTSETAIITGSNEELEAIMKAETALVVDHGSEETEVLSEIGHLLPDFSFIHESEESAMRITMKFKERKQIKEYNLVPYNCFRIVLDTASFIRPDADIRVYRPTTESDTHVFFAGLSYFWTQFDREASVERKSLFGPVDFLSSTWGLKGPVRVEKKGWQFWK